MQHYFRGLVRNLARDHAINIFTDIKSILAISVQSDEPVLTLNDKCRSLHRADFLAFADHCGIAPDYAQRKLADLLALRSKYSDMIATSSLISTLRERLASIVAARLDRLE